MARVTDSEVREIITTSITPLTAYITAANLIINRYATACALATAAELKEMERWLTAHLIAGSDKSTEKTSESIGSVSASYASGAVSGAGLLTSSYGQRVVLLDPCGIILKLGQKSGFVQAIVTDLSQEGVNYEDIMRA